MASKKVIFWGAGATAALGIRTTDGQTRFIQSLAGTYASDKKLPSLDSRIERALGRCGDPLSQALNDLITILGDRADNYRYIGDIDAKEIAAMGRSWDGSQEDLKSRIMHLRLFYDWPALKSLIGICPGSAGEGTSFKLNDLLNLLDLHGRAGFGVRAGAYHDGTEQFFDARRLAGAANALKMLLGTLFYMDYQHCLREKSVILDQYMGFARLLGERVLKQGQHLAHLVPLDTPEFYESDVAFVSLNYDPIALWTQYLANREINKSQAFLLDGVPLESFHDAGHVIPSRRIEKGKANAPWYPMNDAAAQRLNEAGSSRVRLTKFLFPHGCLCWRECPDCGKLSSYYGDVWDIKSAGLFLPPPLRAFEREGCPDRIEEDERKHRLAGQIDARACLHCGTMSYVHHTQMVMQSSFKSPPPSFIEEIQRDLRAVAMKAEHIIFMGYSLPLDDVSYRAFFSARCQRFKTIRCTIVDLAHKKEHQHWFGPKELVSIRELSEGHSTIKAASDIFGADNVRFYGGGVPGVFLRDKVACEGAMERLLNWSET